MQLASRVKLTLETTQMGTLKRVIRRHGAMGCMILAVVLLARHLFKILYQNELHIWYVVHTNACTRLSLDNGLELQHASRQHMDLLDQLDVGRRKAEQFLADGNDLWIAHEGERAAFCCWIFRGRMPLAAAGSGWHELPPHTVCLEGSVASPHYRGRGVAPAVWSLIAQALNKEGIRTIVTKVELDNTPCRRSVLKVGFREIAGMEYSHIGGMSNVQIVPVADVNGQDRETLRYLQKLAK